jgi:hypothetical protein
LSITNGIETADGLAKSRDHSALEAELKGFLIKRGRRVGEKAQTVLVGLSAAMAGSFASL